MPRRGVLAREGWREGDSACIKGQLLRPRCPCCKVRQLRAAEPTSVFVAVNRWYLPLNIHGVVQKAADASDFGVQAPVKQEMPWLSDASAGLGACAAVAQMIGANAAANLRARHAAGTERIGCDIAQSRDEQRFVAKARRLSECFMRSPEDGNDVLFRESG